VELLLKVWGVPRYRIESAVLRGLLASRCDVDSELLTQLVQGLRSGAPSQEGDQSLPAGAARKPSDRPPATA
jgi:hypothetical protein